MKTLLRKLSVLMMVFCLAFSCVGVEAATTVAQQTSASSPEKGSTKTNTKTDSFKNITKTRHFSKKTSSKKKITCKLSNKTKSGNKITYKKVSGCKYITISKDGKITIAKNIRKLTNKNSKSRYTENHDNHYLKVKMTTSAGNGYKAMTKTYTIKFVIK